MKFIMMAMSRRKESFNKQLITHAHKTLNKFKSPHQFELMSLNDYSIPDYDAEYESSKGIPPEVIELGEKISGVQAIIFSTPEYNGGIPAPFKNIIDWVSRITPMPWPNKNILLLGASPSPMGALRALAHSRVPLESIGVFVYPETFGLPKADQAFDSSNNLKDRDTAQRLEKLLLKFRDYVSIQNTSL